MGLIFLIIIFLGFTFYDIYKYKKANIIFRTKIRTIEIVIYFLIFLVFIGMVYFLSNEPIHYVVAIIGVLFIIIPTFLEGIGKEMIIFYTSNNRNILMLKKEIRYPKVYKNEKYTVLEFISIRGLVKQYYPIEKYEEINNIIFNQ